MSPSKGQREPWPLRAAKGRSRPRVDPDSDPDFDFDPDGCLAPKPELCVLPGVACNAWFKLLGVFIQIGIAIEIVPLIAADNLKSTMLRRLTGEALTFNPRYLDFARHYGFRVITCNKGKGKSKSNEKGRVEFSRRR